MHKIINLEEKLNNSVFKNFNHVKKLVAIFANVSKEMHNDNKVRYYVFYFI